MMRWVALGMLIPNAFSVEAALGRFVRCRYSAIQSNVQTDAYDPRRPEATPSLLSCRPTRRPAATRSTSAPQLSVGNVEYCRSRTRRRTCQYRRELTHSGRRAAAAAQTA